MNVYLDGQFLPLADAKVSPLDRGFVFGDGVYELVPVYSRKPFRLEEHLRRLQGSLDGIRLANPHGVARWRELVEQLIALQDFNDQSVYLQITRGVAPRDQAFPLGVAPTVFMFSQPLVSATQAQKEAGVCAITARDIRWGRCDIKAVSLLANVLARQQAVEAGCAETVMLRDGFLSEGAASNIFAVKNGVLLAPQPSPLILTGITYDVVLELAAAHGIPSELRAISEAELRGVDELWMTSSTKEIMPIVRLDGAPVGDGKQGPMARQMDALYQQFKQQVMRA
ncbi:MAG TPA: D-amino acid aminotransferase [Thiobacillus sp.]|nr:MAG: D-amino acid aminotransferase [Hydrogenophilales bacterium 28-61-11]OYZ58899.1 MAG: D-amino acid aminotransferase [Hydrogenophilales bacterium 16-61-112]OZA46986.1 MAG: D-amino acid aminotransferase [Hydrogenophilales bacterium 17-61-76]HQT30413.1 D-amino acid aminotransferase [Thiobacillus sp.]HQT68975.1 D-amino acid aminotransferase [Thiobacillus sp.]